MILQGEHIYVFVIFVVQHSLFVETVVQLQTLSLFAIAHCIASLIF